MISPPSRCRSSCRPMRNFWMTWQSSIKFFGDSTRIKILYTLFTEERGVGDIARLLGMTMSAISHQLRILKQARLVKPRREGKMVYYALADDHVRTTFCPGLGSHSGISYSSRFFTRDRGLASTACFILASDIWV